MHIDYLLKESEIEEIIFNESTEKIECELSQYISNNAKGIKNFGCSDCDCESHLYYFKNRNEAIESVQNAYKSIAMDFEYFKIWNLSFSYVYMKFQMNLEPISLRLPNHHR